MSAESNICEGCPAAFALGLYTGELENSEGFLVEARRDNARKARCLLENAAGQMACSTMDKHLPDLPETVPATGTAELMEFVSQCPSFEKYMELMVGELEQ